jgi:hypothetical protein
MIPIRVIFWSDREPASNAELDLLAQFRDEIERAILARGSNDAEMIRSPGGQAFFLTNIPKPMIGRIMARWVFLDDETALVTGVRSGEAYEEPD